MAHIIDAINVNRSRFTEWAQEWLTIPSEMYCRGFIREKYIPDIIAVLLENEVFTLEEIQSEFQRNKIHIPETIIKKALLSINHGN